MGWNHQQELVSKVEFKSTLEQLMFFNQQNSLWKRSKRLPGHATAMGTTPWPIPHWHSCFFRWFSLRFSLISMFRTISISLSYLFIIVDPISAGQKLIISQQFSPTFSPTFSGKKNHQTLSGWWLPSFWEILLRWRSGSAWHARGGPSRKRSWNQQNWMNWWLDHEKL